MALGANNQRSELLFTYRCSLHTL